MSARAILRVIPKPVKRAIKRGMAPLRRDGVDTFIFRSRGIIHVGANAGQERLTYDLAGVHVLWIEPIPDVFAELQHNLRGFPQQKALQALISDSDDSERILNVACNHGASSSLFEFGQHKDIWPEVHYTSRISIRSQTLPTVLRRHRIDPAAYDALIMDTQGAELLVLRGCGNLLNSFRYILAEAPNFPSYAGAPLDSDLIDYLSKKGFTLIDRDQFAERKEGGEYFNLLFKRFTFPPRSS